MKPMIVLPPETMSKDDIQMLRDNGLCVVEAADPAKVRFLDPIASAADRPKVEQAAIELSRILLNGNWSNYFTGDHLTKREFASIFVDCLVKGTPLARNYRSDANIKEEKRLNELHRLACEEARAERAAAKAEKAANEKK